MFASMRKRSDAIRDFLAGELHYADLRTNERDYLKQIQLVEGLWAEGKPDKYVMNALVEKWPMMNYVARAIMDEASYVLGDTKKVNREMMRYRASQMALRAYAKAEAKDDYKAMIAATKAFTEANGINGDDKDMPLLENLEPSVNVLVIPDDQREMISRMLGTGVLTQIDFEELELEPLAEPITLENEPDEADE